jgi:parvulin-like peptidyl-prolyl isomerase
MSKGKPGEIRVSHILVEKQSQALEILRKITQESADFGKMAQQFSTCPSKKNGGDLGWFGRGKMVPEFEKAAFALTPGQMTKDPVKTQFGYHLIKRTA